ncbi:DUF3829 domain-containing protein [Paenibacillus sp. CAU 1782]
MKKVLSIALVFTLVTVILGACSGLKDAVSGNGGAVAAAKDTQKYNAYIDLSNFMNGFLETNVYSYATYFGFDEEIAFLKRGFDPETFDGMIISPMSEPTFNQVDEAVVYADTEPSYGVTDEKMKELAPKLKQLLETINEVQSYYSSKSFIEDDFELGKELHTKLVNQYYDFSDAADVFYTEFDVITTQKNLENLEQFKEEGYMLHYHAKSILMNAQEIQQAFYDADVDDSNILDLDSAKYKEMYNALTENVNQFMELAKDDEQKKKEGINSFWDFDNSVEDIKSAATTILEVLESQNADLDPVSVGGSSFSRGFGYFEYFERILSTLINNFNKLVSLGR